MDWKGVSLRFLNRLPGPYDLIVISLVIIIFLNFLTDLNYFKILTPLISVITAVVTDYLISYINTKKGQIKQTAVITGLIVGSIVDFNAFLFAALASFIARVSKHIIRFNNVNVLNPAATGLLIIFIFNPLLETWWVFTPNLFVYIPLVLLGILTSARIMKLYASFSYVFLAAILIILTNGLNNFSIFYIPMFGPFFMITEPKTSPIKREHQILFSFIIVLCDVIFNAISFQSKFLAGLLIANIINAFLLRRLS
jgi:Na+-translocating ferredoxin:NAD+ oxidoreductase RnfD subunit